MAIEYVCGFMFCKKFSLVALIKKKHPEWMSGFLNGIGGKVEPTDAGPHSAMAREFKEETGIETRLVDWRHFATLHHPSRNGVVRFFAADLPMEKINELKQTTDEPVAWYLTRRLADNRIMSNLHWLVPMALDKDKIVAEIWDRS